METGYKLVRSEIFKSLKLSEKSFAIEIEIVMKLARKNLKFFEVGISYNGRPYSEGKKIGTKRIRLTNYFWFFRASDRPEKRWPEKYKKKCPAAVQPKILF